MNKLAGDIKDIKSFDLRTDIDTEKEYNKTRGLYMKSVEKLYKEEMQKRREAEKKEKNFYITY